MFESKPVVLPETKYITHDAIMRKWIIYHWQKFVILADLERELSLNEISCSLLQSAISAICMYQLDI